MLIKKQYDLLEHQYEKKNSTSHAYFSYVWLWKFYLEWSDLFDWKFFKKKVYVENLRDSLTYHKNHLSFIRIYIFRNVYMH